MEAALAPISRSGERGGIGSIFVSLLTDDIADAVERVTGSAPVTEGH